MYGFVVQFKSPGGIPYTFSFVCNNVGKYFQKLLLL